MGQTQQEIAEELIDAFEFLEDRDTQYRYLLDLGSKVPPMNETEKTDENKVLGCQSQVWMAAHPRLDAEKTIDFAATSDGMIARGVIAILLKIYSGQNAQDILSFDIETFLKRIKVDQFFTSQRSNGLYSMVQRIRELAARESDSLANSSANGSAIKQN